MNSDNEGRKKRRRKEQEKRKKMKEEGRGPNFAPPPASSPFNWLVNPSLTELT